MTSLKSSPIWAMTQGGSAIILRPRRRMVVLGFSAVTMVAETALRSIATGEGCCAAKFPAAINWNDCVSAVSKRVAVGLFAPPRVGTNEEPGVMSTKLLLVG